MCALMSTAVQVVPGVTSPNGRSQNISCRSMAGGRRFFQEHAPSGGAAALDFCNMLPPIDRSTVTLRAGTLLAST